MGLGKLLRKAADYISETMEMNKAYHEKEIFDDVNPEVNGDTLKSALTYKPYTQDNGIESKMWRYLGDRRNYSEHCRNHATMDRQRVLINQPFTLIGLDGATYYPMYPRDPILPPCERINCRCSMQSIIPDKDNIFGMTLEERDALQQKAIDEDDGEWERELEARNKAKAGIEEPDLNESLVMISTETKDLLINALDSMRGVGKQTSELSDQLEGAAVKERQHIYMLIDALAIDMGGKPNIHINRTNRHQSMELQRRLVELDEIDSGLKKRKSGEWRSSGFVPFGTDSTPPGSYLFLNQAVEETDALSKRFSNVVEIRILWRLVAASDNPNMSRYQLSLAYKKLADCYLMHNFREKALRVYKMGLSMNPNIAVKRVIKSLEAELLDMTVVDIGNE